MYPDWPKSAADLVPLPHCDGPKLKPFDFHGPQKIEFLEYLGEGMHAHVLKVKIRGQIYALKLVSVIQQRNACKESYLTRAVSFDSSMKMIGQSPRTPQKTISKPCLPFIITRSHLALNAVLLGVFTKPVMSSWPCSASVICSSTRSTNLP